MPILSHELLHLQRDTLRALETRYSKLTDEREKTLAVFEAAKRELERLSLAQDTVRASIVQTSALVDSEIRTIHAQAVAALPAEILRSIFLEFTLDDEEAIFSRGSWSTRRAIAPFCLASVCKTWRSTALQCPLIWSYAGLPRLADDRRNRQRLQAFLHLVLQRSKAAPLDIMLPAESYRDWTDRQQAALTLLSEHHLRWSRVHFFVPGIAPRSILDVFHLPMPRLREIFIRVEPPVVEELEDSRFDDQNTYFPDRTELRKFGSRGWIIPSFGDKDRTSRLSHLSLDLKDVLPTAVWGIFEECAPTLMDLFLYGESAPCQGSPKNQLIMSRLRKIRLRDCASLLRYMTGFLVTPELEDMLLKQFDATLRNEFIRNLGIIALDKLDIDGDVLNQQDVEAFRNLLQLSELTISSTFAEISDFLFALSQPNADELWTLPALDTLVFTRWVPNNDTIVQLVQARRSGADEHPTRVGPIRHVHILRRPLSDFSRPIIRHPWIHLSLRDEIKHCSSCTTQEDCSAVQ